MARAGGFLGAVTWFTIGEKALVGRDDLMKWHEELGLDPALVPEKTRGVDAFRVAIRSLAKVEYPMGTRTARLDFGGEESSRTEVVRELVRHYGDDGGWEVVGRLIYTRPERTSVGNIEGTDTVNYELSGRLGKAERILLDRLIPQALAGREALMEALHPGRLREFVRMTILSENAIILARSQGIYWIPDPDRAETICSLIARFGEGSLMESMPLPDSPRQRDMLGRALGAQVRSDVASIRALIRDDRAKSTGPLSQTRQAKLRQLYTDMVERAQAHAKLIGRPLWLDVIEEVRDLRTYLDEALDPTATSRVRRRG